MVLLSNSTLVVFLERNNGVVAPQTRAIRAV
jgi:hypothetical protein